MPKEKSFESSLNDLERIVEQLEAGDLSLEDSLKLFEQGIKLSRDCQKRLDEAERRVEVLLKNTDGNYKTENFEESEA
jgi:exodeoxyribonuclease VII small subunit